MTTSSIDYRRYWKFFGTFEIIKIADSRHRERDVQLDR